MKIDKLKSLLNKPEVIKLEFGGETFELNVYPLPNRVLMEVSQLANRGKIAEAMMKLVYETIKRDDPEITMKDVEELPAFVVNEIIPYIMKVNGMKLESKDFLSGKVKELQEMAENLAKQ